jgi:formylglycine-generating enzyme required for sulfatase activity
VREKKSKFFCILNYSPANKAVRLYHIRKPTGKEVFMNASIKRFSALFGIILFSAIMVFSFISCGEGPDPDSSGPGGPEIPAELQNTEWVHTSGDKISFDENSVTVTPNGSSPQKYTLKDSLTISQSGIDQTILFFKDKQSSDDAITYQNGAVTMVNFDIINKLNRANNWNKGSGNSGSVNYEMVYVPGGSFQMGNPDTSVYESDDERPVHKVTLSAFYMGKYLVTQAQYKSVMGTNPSHYKSENYPEITNSDNFPVDGVRWYYALVFCNRLSVAEGLTPAYRLSGSTDPAAWPTISRYSERDTTWDTVEIVSGSTGYRLPTEAQWEYAAKGGDGSPGNYLYAGSNNAGDVAWYRDNTKSMGIDGLERSGPPRNVGTKAPNGLGLYDMSGNMNELCWDWYGDYSSGEQADPKGPSSGTRRVFRGGANESSLSQGLRCADRRNITPNGSVSYVGFRVMRP